MKTLQSFIKTRPYLVWSTKNYDGLSDDAIVEAETGLKKEEEFDVMAFQ